MRGAAADSDKSVCILAVVKVTVCSEVIAGPKCVLLCLLGGNFNDFVPGEICRAASCTVDRQSARVASLRRRLGP